MQTMPLTFSPPKTEAEYNHAINELMLGVDEISGAIQPFEQRMAAIKKQIFEAKSEDIAFIKDLCGDLEVIEKDLSKLKSGMQERNQEIERVKLLWEKTKLDEAKAKEEIIAEYVKLSLEEQHLSKAITEIEDNLNYNDFSQVMAQKKRVDELKPKLKAAQEALLVSYQKSFNLGKESVFGHIQMCSKIPEFNVSTIGNVALLVCHAEYIRAPLNKHVVALCLTIKKPEFPCVFRAKLTAGKLSDGSACGLVLIGAQSTGNEKVEDAGKEMKLVFLTDDLWKNPSCGPNIQVFCKTPTSPLEKIYQFNKKHIVN